MSDIPATSGADAEALVESEGDSESATPHLTPIDFSQWDYTPGEKAPWRCSPADCFGPDELGEYKGCVDELIAGVERSDSAARIWEVLQAWEQRLFRRNYHFLNVGWKGWGMFGGSAGTTGASILQTQNSMKLFSCNVYGARHKKITALLSREVPPVQPVPDDDDDTMDQQASQEAVPYLKAFREQAKLKRRMSECASYLYTDGAAVFLTYTVADSRYGQEIDENGGRVDVLRPDRVIKGDERHVLRNANSRLFEREHASACHDFVAHEDRARPSIRSSSRVASKALFFMNRPFFDELTLAGGIVLGKRLSVSGVALVGRSNPVDALDDRNPAMTEAREVRDGLSRARPLSTRMDGGSDPRHLAIHENERGSAAGELFQGGMVADCRDDQPHRCYAR